MLLSFAGGKCLLHKRYLWQPAFPNVITLFATPYHSLICDFFRSAFTSCVYSRVLKRCRVLDDSFHHKGIPTYFLISWFTEEDIYRHLTF